MLPPRIAELVESFPPIEPHDRAALLDFARTTPLVYGPWKQFKKLYKKAEAPALENGAVDVELLGALMARIDAAPLLDATPHLQRQETLEEPYRPKQAKGYSYEYSVGGRTSWDNSGWRLIIRASGGKASSGPLNALRRFAGLGEAQTSGETAYDFNAREWLGSVNKVKLNGSLLEIEARYWRGQEPKKFTVDVSDPIFPFINGQSPRRETVHYMKRRVRRLLRTLSENNPELYFGLLVAMLRETKQSTLDPALQWAAMDALFANGARWTQPQSGRGSYQLTQPKFIRATREERVREAWDSHLDDVRVLYLDTKVPPQVNLTALRVLCAQRQEVPQIGREQAQYFLESGEPVLQAVATRAVAAAWTGGSEWPAQTIAAALLKAGGPARRKLSATLEAMLQKEQISRAWREAFAARLTQELESKSTLHRQKSAAALLSGSFREGVAPDALFRHLALFLGESEETANWALERVQAAGTRGEWKYLDDIVRLPEELRAQAVQSFIEGAQNQKISSEAAATLVVGHDLPRSEVGWRVLAATAIDAKHLRELWQRVLGGYHDEDTMRAALGVGAPVELWRRAQWPPEEIKRWTHDMWWMWGRHYGLVSLEFFQALIENLPTAEKLSVLLSALPFLATEVSTRALDVFSEQAREWKPGETDLQRGLNPPSYYAEPVSLVSAWRLVAMSAVEPETLRAVWRTVFQSEFGPEAAQLFRRAQVPAEEIAAWLKQSPHLKASFSPEFFLAVIDFAPDEVKTPLIIEASAEQWQGVRATLLTMLRGDDALLASFWRGMWTPLAENAALRERILGDAALASTFASLPAPNFEEMLPRAEQPHAPLVLNWLNSHESTLSRGDETLLIAATHPVNEVRDWGLSRVRALGLDLPTALRLMEAGLPTPFALGREYLESGSEDESDLALALCDSPSASVREFGREFIATRREKLLNADLLQKLTQHPDAAVQAWLAELLREREFTVDTADFDAAVLRSRGRARRAKEEVKQRLDAPQSTLVDVSTLLEMARGSTLRDREWALQQLARRALAGETIEGVSL